MLELRELTIKDGRDIYEMLEEIGPGENGFDNSLKTETFALFQEKLKRCEEISQGINLGPNYVPQTVYWLFADGRPVGYAKLRHYLNDALLQHGGNIGYVIRPSERQKGYATLLLKEILERAKGLSIERVLITCDESNTASRKVIEANHGQLSELKNNICYYWIDLT